MISEKSTNFSRAEYERSSALHRPTNATRTQHDDSTATTTTTATATAGAVETVAVAVGDPQDDEYTVLTVSESNVNGGKPTNGEAAAVSVDVVLDNTKTDQRGMGLLPARYVFILLGFWGFFTMYLLRTCLNVAMVAMVNSTALAEYYNNINDNNNNNNSMDNIISLFNHNINNISNYSISSSSSSRSSSVVTTHQIVSDCPGSSPSESANSTTDFLEGEFLWDEKTQGLILGSFYYGYIFPQMLGGRLADRVQGKRLLGASLLLSSLLTLVVPSAARAGVAYLVAIRVMQGVAESVSYPAMHALCAKWVPVQERSKLVTFAYCGSEMGAVGGMLMTGLLSRYGFAGGWPSAFYVFGICGCVWFTLWMVLVHESPSQHPRISDTERRYIEKSLGERSKEAVSIPWPRVLTSAPVWGVCVAHVAYNWGYYNMFICLPTYMKQILH